MIETHTIIIGAGPIGLELAVALKDASSPYLQFDAAQLGHTISWFPRQAQFFSSPDRIAICGVPLRTVDQSKATREEYLSYLCGIVQQFSLPIRTYERVVRIERLPHSIDCLAQPPARFRVHTESSAGAQQYTCRHVAVAIGDMHQPRALTLPDLSEIPGYRLPHVHRYFDEPYRYFDRQLLIVGGRNSAVEAAIRCFRLGAQVALSYRRQQIDPSVKYWLRPEIEWLIKTEQIQFFPNTVPTEISPTHVKLVGTNADGVPIHDGQEQRVAADFVLPLIGFQMDPSLLASAGVELLGAGRQPRHSHETMETNVPGIFVAGTAAAGTQQHYRIFIENGHSHVVRITRAITGTDPQRVNPLAFSRLHETPLGQET